MKRCPNCNKFVLDDEPTCHYCGYVFNSTTPPNYNQGNGSYSYTTEYYRRNNPFDSDPASGKSRGVAALLAIFLGYLGVQYFYLGKVGGGLLCILLSVVTCGLWEVVTLIQGIMMLCMDNASFVQKYVNNSATMPLF